MISHRYREKLETHLVNRSTCLHARSECGILGRFVKGIHQPATRDQCGHPSAPFSVLLCRLTCHYADIANAA